MQKFLFDYITEAIDKWAKEKRPNDFIHGYMTGWTNSRLSPNEMITEEKIFFKKGEKK